jgi:diguanylate cyclase (GGDEF)-like protein/PAS domain S-box-containing protein
LLVTPRGEVVASSEVSALGHLVEGEGRHVAEYLHPDDLPAVFDVIERARAGEGLDGPIRVRVRRADGSWIPVEATLADTSDDPALRGGAVVRVRDLGDEPPPTESVADSERFQSLAEALPLGILSADARGYVVFSNHEAEQIFNLPVEAIMGRGWQHAIHVEDREEVLAAAQRVVTHFIPQQVTFRTSTAMFTRWAHAKFVPLGRFEAITGWIATVDDITDRRRAESQLAHLATHDPLTQLPNRLLLEDRLRQASTRLRRGSSSVTLLFFDLDGFKAINDSYGHRAGDMVLIEVANRLRSTVRDVDTVARYGGDEFAIVCESVDEDELAPIIDRLRTAIDEPIDIEGAQLHVSASIGWATTRDHSALVEDLLAEADQAMYREKRRNEA